GALLKIFLLAQGAWKETTQRENGIKSLKLCKQAAVEQDSQKFMELIHEINPANNSINRCRQRCRWCEPSRHRLISAQVLPGMRTRISINVHIDVRLHVVYHLCCDAA